MALIIETNRLRERPERFRGRIDAGELDLDFGDLGHPGQCLEYDLAASVVSGELIVRGTLAIECRLRCSRCGAAFSRRIKANSFSRAFRLSSKNELIDLTPDVREDILLALPMVTLCSDKCLGICGICGVNLNRGKCGCRRGGSPGAWEALDKLKI